MKANHITVPLFVGIALLAGCSERSVTTAPSASAAAFSPAGFIGDRRYAWSLSCETSSKNVTGGISANWSWTENGVTIAGTEQNAFCSPDNKVSGSGLRPASANGFLACVGNFNCTNWTSWTFDASGSFQAQLKGSVTWYCDPLSGCTKTLVTVSGTFRVDS